MKQFLLSLSSFLICFFLISCKKSQDAVPQPQTIVKGTVIHDFTLELQKGIKVFLIKEKASQYNQDVKIYEEVKELITDQNGRFEMAFQPEEGVKYFLSLFSYQNLTGAEFLCDNARFLKQVNPSPEINPGQINEKEIRVLTKHPLVLHLKNAFPFGDSDTLQLHGWPDPNIENSFDSKFIGSQIDTVLYGCTYAGVPTTLRWISVKNGIQNAYEKLFPASYSDTIKLELNY